MKKRTMIALIVAAALVVSGAVVIAIGLYTGGENTYTFSLEERKVTIGQTFESIAVQTGDCDVNFVPFDGNADAHIVFMEREKVSHHTSVQGGVLKIRMTDQRQWMDFIGFGGKSMEMTIYLPRKQYESLRVATDTGDIQIPKVLCVKQIQLRSDTGDVLCEGFAEQSVSCFTDTGDMTVKSCAPQKLELRTDTGDVKLQELKATELHLETDTGKVAGEDISCTTFTCKTDTGDVVLKALTASDYLQVFTNTGDVQIRDSDTSRINIETDTGDVHVPKAWQQKAYHIESDTGNIRFE